MLSQFTGGKAEEKPESVPLRFGVVVWWEAGLQNRKEWDAEAAEVASVGGARLAVPVPHK